MSSGVSLDRIATGRLDELGREEATALVQRCQELRQQLNREIKEASRSNTGGSAHCSALQDRRKALGDAMNRVSNRLRDLRRERRWQSHLPASERPRPPSPHDAFRTGPPCPVCGRNSYPKRGRRIAEHLDPYAWFWTCSPRCDTRVGCYPGTQTALGTLADEVTRCARKAAHNEFDALVAEGAFADRSAAYAWLASMMDQSEQDAHIGMYGLSECNRVMALCRQYRAAMAVTERRALLEEQGR